ncbi:MAG: bifunctional adenosylcobinamide kinase/adenosylcobinamide-phosphate guanylyltransferase [Candidatus Metalachnospira sp.]|nr:bifunctional adenosylcobinamide kinase/adenosylcobinamide-phosphate guanylyltransferase [Candidatus Metalachnospira sp.]
MSIFGEDKSDMFVLVTGGAASGKSAFAESIIVNSGYGSKLYIATMRPFDEESIRRIEKHHVMRKDKGFSTVEIYGALFGKDGLDESVISKSAVILECMSNYLNNMLFDENGMISDLNKAEDAIKTDIVKLVKLCPNLTIVTNEIFSDGIFYPTETTRYIQILGKLNILMAKYADEVYEVVCGIPVCVKKVCK